MYNLPEMQVDNAAFWLAIRTEAERLGAIGLPQKLDFARNSVPARIEPDTIFTQVCGWPLQTIYAGQAIVLGVPVYGAPYCVGPTHVGVFVVRRDTPFRSVADLRGCDFLFNSLHSNSGMNLPRRVIAELAGGRPFFRSIVETHGHPISLERVAHGEADATCVDCVTFAFFARHHPVLAKQLRVLAATPPTPAIPFVTAAATDPVMKATLAQALRCVAAEPKWAAVRGSLLLLDIVPPDQVDYGIPCRYAAEAVALGYPRLH